MFFLAFHCLLLLFCYFCLFFFSLLSFAFHCFPVILLLFLLFPLLVRLPCTSWLFSCFSVLSCFLSSCVWRIVRCFNCFCFLWPLLPLLFKIAAIQALSYCCFILAFLAFYAFPCSCCLFSALLVVVFCFTLRGNASTYMDRTLSFFISFSIMMHLSHVCSPCGQSFCFCLVVQLVSTFCAQALDPEKGTWTWKMASWTPISLAFHFHWRNYTKTTTAVNLVKLYNC